MARARDPKTGRFVSSGSKKKSRKVKGKKSAIGNPPRDGTGKFVKYK